MKSKKKYGKPTCRFKAALGGEEYRLLEQVFRNRGDWSECTYLYFDTSRNEAEAELCARRLRLRVRIKDGRYSIELKDYCNPGHREAAQNISEEEFRDLLRGLLPRSEIKCNLSRLGLQNPIVCINIAHTTRKKMHFHEGILVLDQTIWHGGVTYEIEYRSEQEFSPQIIRYIRRHFLSLNRPRPLKLDALWQDIRSAA